MEKVVNQKYDWVCYICEKHYASQSSLSHHNKRFHNDENVNKSKCNVNENVNKSKCNVNVNVNVCKYCDKVFNSRQGKYQHKKFCKEKIKQEQSLTITGNTNNSHNTNYITYNFNSEQDRERVPYFLDNDQKVKLLLESYHNYIPKLVEKIYCGEYIQFRNVLIKNLRSNYCYIFKDNRFVAENKNAVLNTLVENNYWNIENIADDLECDKKIKLKENIKKKIKKSRNLFNKMYESNDSYYDNDVKYKNFKEYNKEKITLLIFNNKDKIKDKYALLSGEKLTEKEIDYMIQLKKWMEEEDAEAEAEEESGTEEDVD